MANIKSYDCNNKTKLTKNISVKELKCLGKGHIHNTKIDVDHFYKVQEFMNENGYNKVIFSCGYRCKEYEKLKKRSGTSQHCVCCASDQRFYKDGKPVSAKEVCCKAQDFGFNGIGYIDKYYVHLDSRAKGKYRGDETIDYSNNVPNGDFYAYFGIKRDGQSDEKETYKGILPKLPKRGYFFFNPKTPKSIYDKGSEVKKLQEFLNWAIDAKLKVDGYYGIKCFEATEKFQEITGIKIDGYFGKDCLSKAKSFEK